MNFADRLACVRQQMNARGLDALIIPRADEYLGEYIPEQRKVLVDRSFPGDTAIADINKWLHINLPIKEDGETLEDLMELSLGRRPDLGDSVRIDSFELSVEETSFIAGRTILISSIS